MIMPFGASSFSEALRMGVETFHSLKSVLSKKVTTLPLVTKAGLLPT